MAVINRRIGWLMAGFCALLSLAVLRAGQFGVLEAATLRRQAVSEHVILQPLPAVRGSIVSSDGVTLAMSEAADEVIADPFLTSRDDLARYAPKLSRLLGSSEAALLSALTRPGTGYVVLAREVTPQQAGAVMALHINGINVTPEVRRVYPLPWTASQVIGTVNSAGAGDAGLEYEYNRVLAGRAGERRIVQDALGQSLSVDDTRAMRPGQTLTLTLNAALQSYVEQVLAGVGAQYHPKNATAIVINPDTGAILALANWPRVDANEPGSPSEQDWMDQAVDFSYEPGSTFKAITVAGAIQDGLVNPSTEIYVPSVLQVYNRQIHDAEWHPGEMMTVAQILKVSSNIGAAKIGMMLGPQRFNHWVRAFGFGAPTGVDLPGEQAGIVPEPSQYSGVSLANMPFGQGESVTPIQMAAAYSAIANGGWLRSPHIVSAIGGRAVPLPPAHRIISASTAAELRDMLRGVFDDGGTASGAAIPGYDLAGKTGTANVAVNGSYSTTEYIASFIGMVPAADPKLVVEVMVNQPQGSIYGGQVAAPAFKRIVGWAVPYFGIDPNPAGVSTSQTAASPGQQAGSASTPGG
ncbi:MAG TPA: penicillin-binding protein 2 [Solirubrobacteraceae bacterium]|nr:penicillin-binding protein 2 [Solirubrobacteraceae bacterium]